MTAEDHDQAEQGESKKMHIVVTFNDKPLTFLYSKTKPLEKLLLKFCENMNLERNQIRFTYNGQSIRNGAEVTAKQMEMEVDEDGEPPIIEGHMFQEGG
ncbi:Rad60-SLD domain-containing protein [Mycena chlorophos]|uniref:Rad60-SLD domain-containing protein n=1 Tax=Mycena chlorophos TaxID=658473 RepID=A0A8H6SBD0_MYCCL|nr:Rad60-SLD domain-containing protein [Mycena chlorophos]